MIDAKRWSANQDQGLHGEDLFRAFARRHGLLPSKLENDVGIDFVCQAMSARSAAGVREVIGSVLGAAVRSSARDDGRIRLDRADAGNLLRAALPVCLVLPHLRESTPPVIAFRFVDDWLAAELHRFLQSEREWWTCRPADLHPEPEFDSELRVAIRPGNVEAVRVRLAAIFVNRVAPQGRIEVRRGTDGELTLVTIGSMTSQFDVSSDERVASLRAATFGQSRYMLSRLARLPLREEFTMAASVLPGPLIIRSSWKTRAMALRVANAAGSTQCAMEMRESVGWIGFAHEAGITLAASDRTLVDGQWVHRLEAHVDEDAAIRLEDYPDLWAFLERCTPEATLQVEADDPQTIPVAKFRDLVELGWFARFQRELAVVFDWPSDTFLLRDAFSDEILHTMDWLGGVHRGDLDSGFAVGVAELDADQMTREPGWFWLPVCANLGRGGIVTWIGNRGQILRKDGLIAGLHVERCERAALEFRSDRWTKGDRPELAVHPSWKGLTFGAAGPNSDVRSWGCQAVFVELQNVARALDVLRAAYPRAKDWPAAALSPPGAQGE